MANSIKNLLQGYTKGIRFVAILTMLLIVGIGQAWGQYTKASSIAVGDVVVLVYESGKKELSSISGYGVGTSYNGTPAGLYELTVEAGSSSGTFSLKNGSTYLSWSSGNSLATTTSKNANSSWKITFSSGNATILNAKDNSRKLQWNASSPRFACYTSGQTAVQLYKKAASYTVNWTINPAAGGILSATSGNTTTVTPNTAYTYGNPAYTVSPVGKATVSQDGDNFTATPSANCTIQINMVEKTPANISFENMGNPTPITTGYYVGDTYTLPTKNDYTCGDKTFVGWSTKIIENSPTKPTAATYFEPGASVTLGATNKFYAVFAEGDGSEILTSITGGDWSTGADGDWSTSGTGTYSGNGVKFDGAGDYVLSPDLSSKNYTTLLLKFKSGYNGSKGSILTFYAYDSNNTLLTNEQVTIDPEIVVPDVSYTAQNTVYEVNISASKIIGSVMIKMTSKTSNLGMKYCELFGVSSSYQNYTTKCVQTYTVKFNSDGGSAVVSQTIEEGNKATKPTDPEKEGYTFVGWYNGETEFDFTTPINSNITLKAKWTINQYTVTLNPNYPDGQTGTFIDKNGNSVDKVELKYDYKTASMNLTDLYREIKLEGYKFNDWYSATSGGSKWTSTGIITKNVTLYAQWSKLYTITLYENDTEIKLTPQTSTSYTLPNELTAGSCQDDTKELVGWSTVAIPNPGDMPTSKFYELGETVTLSEDKTTFYAVFATPTTIPGGTEEKEVTVTVNISEYATANSWINGTQYKTVNIDDNITAIASGDGNTGKYYTTGTNWRLYYSENATLTIEAKDGIIINSLKITYDSEKKGVLLNNGEQISSGEECIVNAESVQFETGLSSGTESGQVRITKMEVTYTTTVQADDIVTYSNYSTTCVPASKLVSIAQTAGQIEFTEGDEFVKATITATYEDESTKDVTSKATFSTPDMTQVGEQTISVSYKEGKVTAETSYKINIKEKTKYTITWWANGEEYRSQTAVEGTAIEVPTTSPEAATYACDDKVFVGWLENEIDEATDEEPTFITDFDKITENKDFFAVFATEENNDESIFTVGKSGDFKIYAVVNGENKYATAYNNGKLGSTSEENSAVIYTFTHKGENQYTIYNGSKYIAYGTEGTDLKTQSDEYLWKIAPATNGKGSWRITSVSTTSRAIIYRTSYDFKAYGTTNITSSGYYDIEIGSVPTTTYSGYVTTCEVTTEALSGKFSTGKYEYAEFATGNLQYKPSTDTWRFAKQQYQVVGEDNINVGNPNYKGWIDMFGWSTNDADNNYGVNPNNVNDFYDGTFQDWGDLFSADENWSTLSAEQWKYLLNTRTNAEDLKQIARVGSVVGIMLFPDVWNAPLTVIAQRDSYFEVDIHNYTLEQWAELEKAGALFLPAAGRRTGGYGNMINKDQVVETNPANLNGGHYKHQDNTNIYCYYWTSTINESTKDVSYLHNIQALGGDKYTIGTGAIWGEKGRYGQSVRLAKVTSTLIEIGGGDNSDVITANEGKVVNVKVNRTFKANDGYYTICLPFNIDADEIGKAYQINTITEHVAGEGINVEFTEVTTLTAGQPYLLLPSKNLENPVFEGVTIVKTTGETTEPVVGAGIKITFTGIINGVGEYTNGNTDYYVGDNGLLYNGTTKKLGLRAFFTITDNNGNPAKVRARVVVGENTATDLDNILNGENTTIKVIKNGQLIIIRNGEKFNAQGQKL